jgi:hypothetical protein
MTVGPGSTGGKGLQKKEIIRLDRSGVGRPSHCDTYAAFFAHEFSPIFFAALLQSPCDQRQTFYGPSFYHAFYDDHWQTQQLK